MHTLVIKVGTSTLTQGSKHLSRKTMLELARQISALHSENGSIVLVTSGAVAAGRETLHTQIPELVLPSKQMLASVGQVRLMELWRDLFSIYGVAVGQMLLTRSDFANRQRYLNVRDTLQALLHHGIIPIINENDAVVMNENRVGDNDNLSALIANMIAADLLVLLTDQSGLFDSNPSENPHAQLIPEVSSISDELRKMAGGAGTSQGTGGMATKVQAATLAMHSGTPTVITTLSEPDVLIRLKRGEKIGTFFKATVTRRESRKRWLLAEAHQGILKLDAGAVEKVCKKGASLLPVGITSIQGQFERGSIVQLISPAGQPVGVGLSNYSSKDVGQLIGLQSEHIEDKLGYSYGHEVVHRDNLVVLQ